MATAMYCFPSTMLGFGAAVGVWIFVLGLGIALVQLWRFGALRKEGGGAGN